MESIVHMSANLPCDLVKSI